VEIRDKINMSAAGKCIACAILISSGTGCSRDGNTVHTPLPPPNGDETILTEVVVGSATSTSWVDEVVPDETGGYYFGGVLDDLDVVARLDRSGGLLWKKPTGLYPRTLRVTGYPDGPLARAFIAQAYPAATEEVGIAAAVFSPDGDRLLERKSGGIGARAWWNDITLLDANGSVYEYIAVGGVPTDYRFRRYAIVFSVSPDSISVLRERVYSKDAGRTFAAVTVDPTEPDGIIHVASNSWWRGEAGSGGISAINRSLDIEWHAPVAVPGAFFPRVRDVVTDGGVIYTVGNAIIRDGYDETEVAFATAVNGSGEIVWSMKTLPGGHNSSFHSCQLDDGYLYAAGAAMYYYESPSNRYFGYGLLSRIDTSAGLVLGHRTFGSPDYQSGFYSLVIDGGGAATCAGYTNYSILDYPRQGWLVEVDLADF
jgi:hypothetical protein